MRALLHLAMLAAGVAAAAAAVPPTDATSVAVLARPVDRGAVLAADDFTQAALPDAAARGALRIASVVGMAATRQLAEGSIVRRSDIARPQLVKRGEPVTIRWQRGALTITAQGRALAGGGAGDAVRVVAGATNRTLDAVVEGSGDVRLIN
jgi:flagella basal body P-ring formation protein FlgA